MIGKRIVTKDNLIAIVMDKISAFTPSTNVNEDMYLCEIIEHMNGDTSESGKAIIIYPQDIISFD